MLGSKLLPEEVDFALAAPDTFTFARGYLSSNPRIGRLGRAGGCRARACTWN